MSAFEGLLKARIAIVAVVSATVAFEGLALWAWRHPAGLPGKFPARVRAASRPRPATRSVADGMTPPMILIRSALNRASRSPEAAMDWLRSLPASGSRSLAEGAVLATWGRTDPRSAMEWVALPVRAAERPDLVAKVFQQWLAQDDVAAATWLLDHEADPMADALIASVATELAVKRNDRALASRWADLVRDDARRAQVLALVQPLPENL